MDALHIIKHPVVHYADLIVAAPVDIYGKVTLGDLCDGRGQIVYRLGDLFLYKQQNDEGAYNKHYHNKDHRDQAEMIQLI